MKQGKRNIYKLIGILVVILIAVLLFVLLPKGCNEREIKILYKEQNKEIVKNYDQKTDTSVDAVKIKNVEIKEEIKYSIDKIENYRSNNTQHFILKKDTTNIIVLKNGTILSIPVSVIKSYQNPNINVIEAFTTKDFILYDLTTLTSKNDLLVSGGMVKIDFYDGIKLVRPESEYSIAFLNKNQLIKPCLFEGIKIDNLIKWEKIAEPVYEFVISYVSTDGIYAKEFTIENTDYSREFGTIEEKDFISLDSLINLSYSEKLELFNILKNESGIEYHSRSFEIIDNRKYKNNSILINSKFPKQLHNRIKPILIEAFFKNNYFIKAGEKFNIKVYEKLYYDSIQLAWAKTRLEQLEKQDSLNIISKIEKEENAKRNFKYAKFEYFTRTTDWLNCDDFISQSRTKKLDIYVNGLSKNVKVYLKIKDLNVFVPLSKNSNRPLSDLMPYGYDLVCIVIDKYKDKFFFRIVNINKDENEVKIDTFDQIDFEKLLMELDKI